MSVFTVFGLQRSGTNFLEQMISEHVGDLQLQNHWRGKTGIWKHAFNLEQNNVDEKIAGLRGDPQKAKLIGTEIKGVYVHKHPYAWIESILRKQIDIKKTHPSVIEHSDISEIITNGINIIKLAELHRDHSRYWLDKVEQKKVYHVKFEDMIDTKEQTKQTIVNIANFFGKRIIKKNINVIDNARLSKPFTEEDRESYKNYQIKTLTFEQIQEVNKVLDRGVLEKQRYVLYETKNSYIDHKI